MAARIFKVNDSVHEYLARIGARGGAASRRVLSKEHARQMVVIREALRAAKKRGRPLSAKEWKQLALPPSTEPVRQQIREIRRGFPFYSTHKAPRPVRA
jgi:hypothetical protein